MARDREEGNLDSGYFREFSRDGTWALMDAMTEFLEQQEEEGEGEDENARKDQLMWLARYERDYLEMALRKLGSEVSDEVMDAITLFIRVTDIHGQIYVVRDIASRMK